MNGSGCKDLIEQSIFFPTTDHLQLEGAFFSGSDRAVVMAHPHPLYGGDMDNPVICELAAEYRARGLTTLRFNFRGAGQSQGTYDQGAGEQKDLLAAVDYVLARGARTIDLIGYSFGAWVLAHADTQKMAPGNTLMIAPPAAMMNFDKVRPCPRLKLVVTGSQDEIAPPAQVDKLLSRLNPEAQLLVVSGADHFFSGKMTDLKSAVSGFADDQTLR